MSTPPPRSVITLALLFFTFVVALSPARASDDDSRARRALQRALELTSLEAGVRVLFIEPDLAPRTLPIGGLDAFVIREPSGTPRPRRFGSGPLALLCGAAGAAQSFALNR